MFQIELSTMVRQEQMRDLVRGAAKRRSEKNEQRDEVAGRLGRLLIAAPLCLSAARLFVFYVLQV